MLSYVPPAGEDLALSVPGDRAPVVAVPPARSAPVLPVFRQVTLTVPETVATWAEERAQETGQTVEQVLAELVADGHAAKTNRPVTGATCPDGRPHRQGTINPRHCMRCAAPV